MKTKNVVINDKKTIREIEKKLEKEHVESMKKMNEEIQALLKKYNLRRIEDGPL